MPAVPIGYSQQGNPCFNRIKQGCLIGVCIGLTTGFLIGGYLSIRSGVRGKDFLKVIGKTMIQSGGSFGTFLAIGSAIRC